MGRGEDVFVVFVTVPPKDDLKMAHELVECGLAACVNTLSGVISVYRWKGEVVEDRESLLVIKTSASRLEELVEKIKELHEYSVPEIIAIRVEGGNEDYINWVISEVQPRTS